MNVRVQIPRLVESLAGSPLVSATRQSEADIGYLCKRLATGLTHALITYAWTVTGRWLHDTAASTLHKVPATIYELTPCFIMPNKLTAHVVKLKGKSGHAECERVDNN